jgi:transketolase
MRKTFFKELYEAMKVNKDIFALTGDLGFVGFDKIRDEFPDRFLNCGASEATMLDIAVGLAYSGKIPFVYTITSFYLRAAETINTYIHHEQLPIKMIGSGIYDNYKHDGYSHDGTKAQNYFRLLNIKSFYPKIKEEIPDMLREMITNGKPTFAGLIRD